ncbi:hypothetical protein BCR36DRAFT_182336, partial [Piromyces finnis]
KSNDERKRQRADSENDAFRKSIKTEPDEYVANPRISNNNNNNNNINNTATTIKHPNDNPINITKYMDLEPRPMSAPANLERSCINDSDSENANEANEKGKKGLGKFSNLEKSLSQSNSPTFKNSKNSIKSRRKSKAKFLDNNKMGKHEEIEKDDLTNDNNNFEKTNNESIKNC